MIRELGRVVKENDRVVVTKLLGLFVQNGNRFDKRQLTGLVLFGRARIAQPQRFSPSGGGQDAAGLDNFSVVQLDTVNLIVAL